MTADLQGPDLYFSVHPPALANNEDLAADDFPLQVTIHANGAAEAQLALQLNSFPQESANLAEVNGERTAAVGSSPLLLYRLDPLPSFPLPPVQYDLNFLVVREISHQGHPAISMEPCQDHRRRGTINETGRMALADRALRYRDASCTPQTGPDMGSIMVPGEGIEPSWG